MPGRLYTINRALTGALALNALLLLAVLALTFIRQGTAVERFLLLAALVPMTVIAVESSLRQVEVGDRGVVVTRCPRCKSPLWYRGPRPELEQRPCPPVATVPVNGKGVA